MLALGGEYWFVGLNQLNKHWIRVGYGGCDILRMVVGRLFRYTLLSKTDSGWKVG